MRLSTWLLWVCLVAPLCVAHAQDAASNGEDVYSDDAVYADDAFEDSDIADGNNTVDQAATINDPLEGFNRAVFWFNDKLYFYALKPVAKAYRVVPEPARTCVGNFFNNLTTPIRLGNALLQGKFHDGASELTRFIFNTTIGLGGLFDPADKLAGVRKKDEDFGQTLSHYGVGDGFYIVLPFFGPSSARDSVGLVVDTLADPTHRIWEDETYWGVRTLDVINTVSLDKDTYELIKRDAFDPYLFIRDAYYTNRQRKIAQ